MKIVTLGLAAAIFSVSTLKAQDAPAEWNLTAQTIVVYNPDFPQSRELASYYAKKRGISDSHVIGLKCPQKESLSRDEFNKLLRIPLLETFSKNGCWQMEERTVKDAKSGKSKKASVVVSSQVRVLALMRGVPYQVRRAAQNPQTMQEDEASVDSELTLLGIPEQGTAGALRNPYFKQTSRFEMFQGAPGFLLVGRLDGPDDGIVRQMIDDALLAEQKGLRGRAVIDLALKTGPYEEGEEWLRTSVKQFRDSGVPVYVERTEPLLRENWPLPDTAFYFGWYASDISGAIKSPAFHFKPGAIACHLHSFSATHLRSREYGWAGPLLAQGATATLGNVYEPFLSLTTHFDVFTKRLLEGYCLAEAAWNATPVISWMNVVLGDPLYRPYRQGAGASLGDGRERDYALYQGTVLRTVEGETDSRTLKSNLVRLAETRDNPHLLELTALYSASESKPVEARELLEHAQSVYPEPADQLRVLLYRVELLVREGKSQEAVQLLKKAAQTPGFKELPAFLSALSLLRDLGG